MLLRRLKTAGGHYRPKETLYDDHPTILYSRIRRGFIFQVKDKDERLYEIFIKDKELSKMVGSIPASLLVEIFGDKKANEYLKAFKSFAERENDP